LFGKNQAALVIRSQGVEMPLKVVGGLHTVMSENEELLAQS